MLNYSWNEVREIGCTNHVWVVVAFVVLECSQQTSAACECCGLDRLLCHFSVLVEWWMALGCLGVGMDGEGMDRQLMAYVNLLEQPFCYCSQKRDDLSYCQ